MIVNAFYKFGEEGVNMRVVKVRTVSIVDPTRYTEGDVFITSKTINILANGKIEKLMTESDVKKLIQKEMKKVKKDDK